MTDEALITCLAIRHSVSPDAVRTVLRALRSGGGMAQFSHADFGGMSQWSPGMTMVGDLFNNDLKLKLDAICTEHTSARPDPTGLPRTGVTPASAIVRPDTATNGGRPILELRVPSVRKTPFDMPCFGNNAVGDP
jgi:hypothetical protein